MKGLGLKIQPFSYFFKVDFAPKAVRVGSEMNQKILNRCVETAYALKPKVKDQNTRFHVCFGVRKSKIDAIGINDYNKIHPYHKFGRYLNHKGFETEYMPSLHAEVSLITKIGMENLGDYELVNVRIGNDGLVRMSCPCLNCTRVLQQLRPRSLWFSNDEGKFELDERF